MNLLHFLLGLSFFVMLQEKHHGTKLAMTFMANPLHWKYTPLLFLFLPEVRWELECEGVSWAGAVLITLRTSVRGVISSTIRWNESISEKPKK